jgi:hypothetical protein
MYEARSLALLGEFGKERGSPFLKRREVAWSCFSLRLTRFNSARAYCFSQVPLTMPAVDQILDLAPDTPIHRS